MKMLVTDWIVLRITLMLDSHHKRIVFSRPKRHVASHSLSNIVHLNASGLILFKLSDVRIAKIAFEHSRLCRESLGVRRFVPDEFLSVVMNIIWARGSFGDKYPQI